MLNKAIMDQNLWDHQLLHWNMIDNINILNMIKEWIQRKILMLIRHNNQIQGSLTLKAWITSQVTAQYPIGILILIQR